MDTRVRSREIRREVDKCPPGPLPDDRKIIYNVPTAHIVSAWSTFVPLLSRATYSAIDETRCGASDGFAPSIDRVALFDDCSLAPTSTDHVVSTIHYPRFASDAVKRSTIVGAALHSAINRLCDTEVHLSISTDDVT